MGVYTIAETAVQVSQDSTSSSLLVNQGGAVVYLDRQTSVNPQYAALRLHPNQSVEWQGGALWARCDVGKSSELSQLFDARGTSLPFVTGNVTSVSAIDVLDVVQSTHPVLKPYDVGKYQAVFFSAVSNGNALSPLPADCYLTLYIYWEIVNDKGIYIATACREQVVIAAQGGVPDIFLATGAFPVKGNQLIVSAVLSPAAMAANVDISVTITGSLRASAPFFYTVGGALPGGGSGDASDGLHYSSDTVPGGGSVAAAVPSWAGNAVLAFSSGSGAVGNFTCVLSEYPDRSGVGLPIRTLYRGDLTAPFAVNVPVILPRVPMRIYIRNNGTTPSVVHSSLSYTIS